MSSSTFFSLFPLRCIHQNKWWINEQRRSLLFMRALWCRTTVTAHTHTHTHHNSLAENEFGVIIIAMVCSEKKHLRSIASHLWCAITRFVSVFHDLVITKEAAFDDKKWTLPFSLPQNRSVQWYRYRINAFLRGIHEEIPIVWLTIVCCCCCRRHHFQSHRLAFHGLWITP